MPLYINYALLFNMLVLIRDMAKIKIIIKNKFLSISSINDKFKLSVLPSVKSGDTDLDSLYYIT